MDEHVECASERSAVWRVHEFGNGGIGIFAPGLPEPVSMWHGAGALGIALRTVEALNRIEREVA